MAEEKEEIKFDQPEKERLQKIIGEAPDDVLAKLETKGILENPGGDSWKLDKTPRFSDLLETLNDWRRNCCTKWLQDRYTLAILPQIADTLNAHGVEAGSSDDLNDITGQLEFLWGATLPGRKMSVTPKRTLLYYEGSMGGWRVDLTQFN